MISQHPRFRTLVAACAVMLAACTSIDGPSPVMIPNKELVISRSLAIPADVIMLAIATYLVIDPLAPNWRVEESALGGDRYLIALTKKRFTTGGDGEAGQVFRRRVAAIAREQGYASHDVLEYAEGIESNVPIAQRVTHGVVQFARVQRPN